MPKYLDWRDGVIRDGFDQRGFIDEEEGLHPAVRFTFRPLLPEQIEEVEGRRDRLRSRGEDAQSRGELVKVLNSQLRSWDLKFDGSDVPLSLDNIRRLRMALQSKIYNVILGFVPGDIDPNWQDEGLEALPPLESLAEEVGK